MIAPCLCRAGCPLLLFLLLIIILLPFSSSSSSFPPRPPPSAPPSSSGQGFGRRTYASRLWSKIVQFSIGPSCYSASFGLDPESRTDPAGNVPNLELHLPLLDPCSEAGRSLTPLKLFVRLRTKTPPKSKMSTETQGPLAGPGRFCLNDPGLHFRDLSMFNRRKSTCWSAASGYAVTLGNSVLQR